MKGKKPARKFGGRPTENKPEPGTRTHLSLAIPLPLKRKIEQAAIAKDWSISSEAVHRLEQSFSLEQTIQEVRELRDQALKAVKQMRSERELEELKADMAAVTEAIKKMGLKK
jgi:hypothetical protein